MLMSTAPHAGNGSGRSAHNAQKCQLFSGRYNALDCIVIFTTEASRRACFVLQLVASDSVQQGLRQSSVT